MKLVSSENTHMIWFLFYVCVAMSATSSIKTGTWLNFPLRQIISSKASSSNALLLVLLVAVVIEDWFRDNWLNYKIITYMKFIYNNVDIT